MVLIVMIVMVITALTIMTMMLVTRTIFRCERGACFPFQDGGVRQNPLTFIGHSSW